MTDIPTIAFIGLPLLTGCIGVGLGYWLGGAPNGDEGYWKAIAEREEKRAAANHRKFVNAAKECNAIADSNARLQSAIDAHHDTFDQIFERVRHQKSGTARWVAKMVNPKPHRPVA